MSRFYPLPKAAIFFQNLKDPIGSFVSEISNQTSIINYFLLFFCYIDHVPGCEATGNPLNHELEILITSKCSTAPSASTDGKLMSCIDGSTFEASECFEEFPLYSSF